MKPPFFEVLISNALIKLRAPVSSVPSRAGTAMTGSGIRDGSYDFDRPCSTTNLHRLSRRNAQWQKVTLLIQADATGIS